MELELDLDHKKAPCHGVMGLKPLNRALFGQQVQFVCLPRAAVGGLMSRQYFHAEATMLSSIKDLLRGVGGFSIEG